MPEWASMTQQEKVGRLLVENGVATAEEKDCVHFGVHHFCPGTKKDVIDNVLKGFAKDEGYRIVLLRDLTYLLLKDAS